jgi:hypothetical protein
MDATGLFPAQGPMNGEQLRALCTMACKIRRYKCYTMLFSVPNSLALNATMENAVQFEQDKSFLLMGIIMVGSGKSPNPTFNDAGWTTTFYHGRTRQQLQLSPQEPGAMFGSVLSNYEYLPEYVLFNGNEMLHATYTKLVANPGGATKDILIIFSGIEYSF